MINAYLIITYGNEQKYVSKIAFSHTNLCYTLATEHLWCLLRSASLPCWRPIVNARAHISFCPFTTLLHHISTAFAQVNSYLSPFSKRFIKNTDMFVFAVPSFYILLWSYSLRVHVTSAIYHMYCKTNLQFCYCFTTSEIIVIAWLLPLPFTITSHQTVRCLMVSGSLKNEPYHQLLILFQRVKVTQNISYVASITLPMVSH